MDESAPLEELAKELSALRDLFQRRLLDDKAKARLYEELYSQAHFARDELARKYLRPLYGELLLLIDRLSPYSQDAVAGSVIDELEELLARRGVRKVAERTDFDPRYHEAARSEASADHPKGTLLAELRVGYMLDEELLRPTSVVVSSGRQSSHAEETPEPRCDSGQDFA